MQRTAGRRHAPRARHVARTRPLKRIATVLAVVVSLLLVTGSAVAAVAYYRLNGNINKVPIVDQLGSDRPEKVTEPRQREALNMLVMGSDARAEDTSFGQRSDTTILLHLAADRSSAVLVSIPRDTIVDIPECLTATGEVVPARNQTIFNDAFSEGGPACTVKTVESLTDIRMDNYVVVDFRGFKDMVNALGGVEVCVPEAVSDPKSRLDLEAGRQTVQGQQALAYVRTRYALGNGGDLSRIDRQQAFLGSMVKKVQSTGLLLRPDRLLRFLDAATKSLTTDLGSLNDLRKLAQEVRGVRTRDVTFLTAPNEPYPADPNRVQLKPAAEALWTALRLDQPLPGKGTRPTATATPTGPPLVTPPGDVRVEVLNGSGVEGEATRVAGELTEAGFVVVAVGNADRSDYASTTVRHDPGYDESGRTLAASLPGSTLEPDLALGTTLVVTVGSDAPSVSAVEVSGATPSPEPTEELAVRTADQDICG